MSWMLRPRMLGRLRARTVWVLAVMVAGAALAGCSSGGSASPASTTAGQAAQASLNAEVASYDLAAGARTRFLVGLVSGDNQLVSDGTVQLAFAYLGRDKAASSGQVSVRATGQFLPIPSVSSGVSASPRLTSPSESRGVYAAEVVFDRPGYWGVLVNADVQGKGAMSATSTFQVAAKHQVPAVGEVARKTANLTMASRDAPKAAIDSRAQTGGRVPDPELHQTTIAQALAAHRPVVAVFSTPVYCVSRFCGPVTDMVAQLASRYRDRAAFVHVEIWRDFDKKMVNKAAADWLLLPDGNLNEPWVFVVGPDGKITTRLDNVATRGEVEAAIQRLPRS